jgi:hypothetical protein
MRALRGPHQAGQRRRMLGTGLKLGPAAPLARSRRASGSSGTDGLAQPPRAEAPQQGVERNQLVAPPAVQVGAARRTGRGARAQRAPVARPASNGRRPAQAPSPAVYASDDSASFAGTLKVVGVGARGISAIGRLMGATPCAARLRLRARGAGRSACAALARRQGRQTAARARSAAPRAPTARRRRQRRRPAGRVSRLGSPARPETRPRPPGRPPPRPQARASSPAATFGPSTAT